MMDHSAGTSPTTCEDCGEEEEHDDDYVPESLKAFIADADAKLQNFLVVPTPQKSGGRYEGCLPETPHSDVIAKYNDDFGVNPAYYVTDKEAKENGVYLGLPGGTGSIAKTQTFSGTSGTGAIFDLNKVMAQEANQETELVLEQQAVEALVEKTAKLNIGPDPKVGESTDIGALSLHCTTRNAVRDVEEEVEAAVVDKQEQQGSKLTKPATDTLVLDDDLSIGTQLSDDLSIDDGSFFPNEDSVESITTPAEKKLPKKVTKQVIPSHTKRTSSPKVDRTLFLSSSKPKTRTYANSISPNKKKRKPPLNIGQVVRPKTHVSKSEEEIERQKRIEQLKAARKLRVPLKLAKTRTVTTPHGPSLHTGAKNGNRQYSIACPQTDKQISVSIRTIETDVTKRAKTSRTRRLTIPVGPKLRTQAKNGVRRYSVVHDKKSRSETNELGNSQSPRCLVRSLTVPRAPKLQTQALHGDRHYSAVGKREDEHLMTENRNIGLKRKKKRGLTVPVAPNLLSVSRRRVKAQVDKENVSDNRAHTFKAAPIGPGVLSKASNSKTVGGILGIPKVPKKTLTTPKPFRLRSSERSALKMVNSKKDDDEGSKSSFRARPVPNMANKPRTSIPMSKKRSTTLKPFNLQSEERMKINQATHSLPMIPPQSSQKSSKRRTLTEPKPFNLRMDKRMPLPPSPPKHSTSKERDLDLTKSKPFHLRTIERAKDSRARVSVPGSNLPCPPKLTRKRLRKRELTTPRPFRLRTSKRGIVVETQTADKAPSPEKLIKSERRQATVPKPFQLSSNRRRQNQSSSNSFTTKSLQETVSSSLASVPAIMSARSRERELQMENAKRLVSVAEELSLLPSSSDLSMDSSVSAE